MKTLKHIMEQPFVFATGLSALVHSTWSLGTLFSGEQPELNTLEWWAWLIPALLIAFALDIGQISTSAQIRAYGNSHLSVSFNGFWWDKTWVKDKKTLTYAQLAEISVVNIRKALNDTAVYSQLPLF